MSKAICWELPDGTIAINRPNPKARLEGESDVEWHARRMRRLLVCGKQLDKFGNPLPAGRFPAEDTQVSLHDESDFPTDLTFREAWVFDERRKPMIDMDRARTIQRERLRRERAPMLAALDVEFVRALEAGADTKAIVAEKQRLRDLPADPRIDAAQSPDELKAIRAQDRP